MSFFASLRSSLVLLIALAAGCSSEGWPSGHVCDQELPITFPGMLGLGIPNGDDTFTPLLGQACGQFDYDDDDVPAGGDVLDAVNEYDSDLEGEAFGWVEECVYVPPEGYNPYSVDRAYDYDEGCRMYWRGRLEEACAGFDAGTVGVAPSDLDFEIEAYELYCTGEFVQ